MQLTLDALLAEVPEEQIDEAREFYSSRASGRGPSTFEELRDVRRKRGGAAPAEPPAVVEIAASPSGPVPMRILAPRNVQARGVYLDIHGGGFYMDSAAHSDARNRALADALDFAVVSVDYRLAPEHPWPAAPDDCEAVALWLVENSVARFGTSQTHDWWILSGSDSGNGHLASSEEQGC